MLAEIPKAWREAVMTVLRRGTKGRDILVRKRAREEWSALTLNPFESSLFAALANALRRDGLQGRVYPDMEEPGETYGFVFDYAANHGTVRVYAKLNLQPGGKVVIVYSAHRPLKQDELTQ
jgi:hypothetical protein